MGKKLLEFIVLRKIAGGRFVGENMNNQLSKSGRLQALLLLIFTGLVFQAQAQAATYTVTTTADSGAGSLRTMIASINAAPTGSADAITFSIPTSDPGCAGGVCTITLTSGEIAIQKIGNSTLTISGTGASSLILSGNNTNRIFTFTSGGVGSSVTLNGVTVSGGKAAYGGAIFTNAGTFNISNSTFTGNAATGSAGGGAIYCSCKITNSTFTNNSAAGGQGGAIHIQGNGFTMANSIISGNNANDGGGIFDQYGSMSITNSTISGNNSAYGGAISFDSAGSDYISNSTLSGNTTTVHGGAIYEFYSSVYLTDTTITNNSSPNGDGGAMFIDRGSFYFTNCTVSNNYSKYEGGGIYAYTANVYESKMLNTIVAANTSTTTSKDYYGPFQSLGNNILGDDTGATITGTTTGNQVGTTTAPINAKLAPLASNGGFTLTRALLAGSPAIDAGTNTSSGSNVVPGLDQRGAARSGATDIGAYEVNSGFVANLPNGYTNLVYGSQIVPDKGNFTYSVTAGSLPPGLNLTTTPVAGGTVSVSGTPTMSGIYNFTVTGTDGVNSTTTYYTITILAPTAAGTMVGGRVTEANGRGIFRALVTMTDAQGNQQQAFTNQQGYYQFEDVTSGQVYVFTAMHRRYMFDQPNQVQFVGEEQDGINFVGTTNGIFPGNIWNLPTKRIE